MATTLKFTKEEHIKTLSLDELEKTLSSEDIGARKRSTAPIPHYRLINDIKTIIDKFDLQCEEESIIVSKRGLKRIPRLDPTEEYILESIMVQNIIALINLTDFDNEEMNMMLAISYSEKGIVVAFGTKIKICSNMTIMGAPNLLQTYGQEKVPYDKLIELLQLGLSSIKSKWDEYQEKISLMKSINLNEKDSLYMLGQLLKLSVENAYIDSTNNSPFNISETTAFTKDIISSDMLNKEITTMWELYNIGTNIITHSEVNSPTKIISLKKFSDFMMNFEENNIQDAVVVE